MLMVIHWIKSLEGINTFFMGPHTGIPIMKISLQQDTSLVYVIDFECGVKQKHSKRVTKKHYQ